MRYNVKKITIQKNYVKKFNNYACIVITCILPLTTEYSIRYVILTRIDFSEIQRKREILSKDYISSMSK